MCKCFRYRVICSEHHDETCLFSLLNPIRKTCWTTVKTPTTCFSCSHSHTITCVSVCQAAKWPWADHVLHVHLRDADKQESLRGGLECAAISWVIFFFFNVLYSHSNRDTWCLMHHLVNGIHQSALCKIVSFNLSVNVFFSLSFYQPITGVIWCVKLLQYLT